VLGRPTIFPAPVFALRLALGEVAEVLVSSQRCVPLRMQAVGYRWRYETLEAMLRAAVSGDPLQAKPESVKVGRS
jgi:NAD dependent epimerase/dehydratase family enzyme